MTAEQRDAELRKKHPNLWEAYHSGSLPEAGSEFIRVAEEYPLPRERQKLA